MIYLLSYLLGSLLFSPILAKIYKVSDLSKNGSGNLGATNLTRVSGKKSLGLIAALLDGFKAAVASLLATTIEAKVLCGFLAILGHLFPFWRLKGGGKGIASFLGLALALEPFLGLLLLVIWGVTFYFFRLSSLSSLLMISASLFLYPLFLPLQALYPLIPMVGLIFFKHKDNIKKLLLGKEKKL